MTAWSDYLRQQAVVADRVASTMTSSEGRQEFLEIAASYRRDADIEDGTASVDNSGIRMPPRKASNAISAEHG